MSEPLVEFVGYDRDNDMVWRRVIDGRLFGAEDEEEALKWVRDNPDGKAFGRDPVEYVERWGPITKEPT